MSRTVYRYPVQIVDEQAIAMPDGAVILRVARREGHTVLLTAGSHEAVDLWALVDPDAPPRERIIRVAGTGHPLPDAEDLHYLDSVQIADGRLVFHVFEAGRTDTAASPAPAAS